MKNKSKLKTKSILATSLIFLFIGASAQKKSKILGNKSTSKSTNCSIIADNGSEIGTIIKTGGKSYQLNKLNFKLLNKFPETIILKVNLYSLKNNQPDKKMADTKTITVIVPETGDVLIDISSYDFKVKDDFFISVEWMETPAAYNTLFLSSVMLKSGSYLHSSKSLLWEKLKLAAIGFNISANEI
jgi:hypothetical protein